MTSSVYLASTPDLPHSQKCYKRKKMHRDSQFSLFSEMAASNKWLRCSISLLLRHKLTLCRHHDSEFSIINHTN